jgi:D-alanine-D-alanine ligase
MKIAVLLGGISSEREVSLASGLGVIDALQEAGHTIVAIDPARGANQPAPFDDLRKEATKGSEPSIDKFANLTPQSTIDCVNSPILNDCELVFLVLHGIGGEDGTIQALLELRGIRHTGSGVLASALAMNKHMAKIMFEHIGVGTPDWSCISKNIAFDDILYKAEAIGYPLIVKPNEGGSTLGLSIVHEPDSEALRRALEKSFRYSQQTLLETYIPGKELTVSVVAGEPLPVIEIRPQGGLYDYQHKYTKGMTEYLCPAPIDEKTANELKMQSKRIYEAFGCGGFARIDFRLNPNNVPYCLEINTIPGMTGTSLVPKAAAAAGISFPQLCQMIVDDAMNRN